MWWPHLNREKVWTSIQTRKGASHQLGRVQSSILLRAQMMIWVWTSVIELIESLWALRKPRFRRSEANQFLSNDGYGQESSRETPSCSHETHSCWRTGKHERQSCVIWCHEVVYNRISIRGGVHDVTHTLKMSENLLRHTWQVLIVDQWSGSQITMSLSTSISRYSKYRKLSRSIWLNSIKHTGKVYSLIPKKSYIWKSWGHTQMRLCWLSHLLTWQPFKITISKFSMKCEVKVIWSLCPCVASDSYCWYKIRLIWFIISRGSEIDELHRMC